MMYWMVMEISPYAPIISGTSIMNNIQVRNDDDDDDDDDDTAIAIAVYSNSLTLTQTLMLPCWIIIQIPLPM